MQNKLKILHYIKKKKKKEKKKIIKIKKNRCIYKLINNSLKLNKII